MLWIVSNGFNLIQLPDRSISCPVRLLFYYSFVEMSKNVFAGDTFRKLVAVGTVRDFSWKFVHEQLQQRYSDAKRIPVEPKQKKPTGLEGLFLWSHSILKCLVKSYDNYGKPTTLIFSFESQHVNRCLSKFLYFQLTRQNATITEPFSKNLNILFQTCWSTYPNPHENETNELVPIVLCRLLKAS